MESLVFKSAILSSIHRVINGTPGGPDNEEIRANLREIKDLASEHGSSFYLFLIPVRPDTLGGHNSIPDNLHIFQDLSPLFPEPDYFESGDYKQGADQHFNNSGHKKFAEFILSRITNREAMRDSNGNGS